MSIEEIFRTSKSKVEALRLLGFDPSHMNGRTSTSKLKEIAKSVGLDESAVDNLNGIKYRSLKADEYYREHCHCKNCGNTIERDKVLNGSMFCSSSCAATYNNKNRECTWGEKTSRSLQKFYGNKHNVRICACCGKEFEPYKLKSGRFSTSKTCSEECKIELWKKKGLETYQKLVDEGRFQGWKVRPIASYPEKFWIDVLKNNNIQYQFNYYVKEFGYFLDFFIESPTYKLDLEIDGKQHKYDDRVEHDIERDNNLKSENYIIYRIEWNEINSDEGKLKMKNKIDEFLKFYKSLI